MSSWTDIGEFPFKIGEYEMPGDDRDVNVLICPRFEDRNPRTVLILEKFNCKDCGERVSVAESSRKLLEDKSKPTEIICRPCWDKTPGIKLGD